MTWYGGMKILASALALVGTYCLPHRDPSDEDCCPLQTLADMAQD